MSQTRITVYSNFRGSGVEPHKEWLEEALRRAGFSVRPHISDLPTRSYQNELPVTVTFEAARITAFCKGQPFVVDLAHALRLAREGRTEEFRALVLSELKRLLEPISQTMPYAKPATARGDFSKPYVQRQTVHIEPQVVLDSYVSAGVPSMEDFGFIPANDFEAVVVALLEARGFEVAWTQASGDGGVDMFAYGRDRASPHMTVVQVKRSQNLKSIEQDVVKLLELQRIKTPANRGLVVTNGIFSNGAIEFVLREAPCVRLIDGRVLTSWIGEYLSA